MLGPHDNSTSSCPGDWPFTAHVIKKMYSLLHPRLLCLDHGDRLSTWELSETSAACATQKQNTNGVVRETAQTPSWSYSCPVAQIHNNVVGPAYSSHSLTSDKRLPVTVKARPLWYLLSFLNLFFHWVTFPWCDVSQTWGKLRIWIELNKELFATRLNPLKCLLP